MSLFDKILGLAGLARLHKGGGYWFKSEVFSTNSVAHNYKLPGMPIDKDTYEFVVGSIRRERERLAHHFERAGMKSTLIAGIVDDSEDANIFVRWNAREKLDDDLGARGR